MSWELGMTFLFLLAIPRTCQGLWALMRAVLEWSGTWLWGHFLGFFFTHHGSATVRMVPQAYLACVSVAATSSGTFFPHRTDWKQGQGSGVRVIS